MRACTYTIAATLLYDYGHGHEHGHHYVNDSDYDFGYDSSDDYDATIPLAKNSALTTPVMLAIRIMASSPTMAMATTSSTTTTTNAIPKATAIASTLAVEPNLKLEPHSKVAEAGPKSVDICQQRSGSGQRSAPKRTTSAQNRQTSPTIGRTRLRICTHRPKMVDSNPSMAGVPRNRSESPVEIGSTYPSARPLCVAPVAIGQNKPCCAVMRNHSCRIRPTPSKDQCRLCAHSPGGLGSLGAPTIQTCA